MILPCNLRSLSIVRLPDGTYESSVQTDDMASNSFRCRHGDTATEAFVELFRKPVPAELPPMPGAV